MCDTAEDMDEYIEYEFARDCIEIADECEDEDDDGVVLDNDLLLEQHTEQLPEEAFLYEEEEEDEDEDEEEMHDYEIVEELDEDVEQLLISDPALDIKAEVLEPGEQTEGEEETKNFKEEFMDQEVEEDHLIDEDYYLFT